MKDKMDLSLGVAVGSSIQIATFAMCVRVRLWAAGEEWGAPTGCGWLACVPWLAACLLECTDLLLPALDALTCCCLLWSLAAAYFGHTDWLRPFR